MTILVAVLVTGLVWLLVFICWLGWKLYTSAIKYDRQATILAAYKEALQRPAVALLTQEQLEFIASYISPGKKEYLN